jgi:triacylglycerol lipase
MKPNRAIPSLLRSPSLLIPPVAEDPSLGPDRYVYFEQSGKLALLFQPQAHGLCWSNAWWLAECALLAYERPDIATPLFLRAGFTNAQQRTTPDLQLQCYILDRPDAIVIAFRGTVIPSPTLGAVDAAIKNWTLNFGIRQDDIPNQSGEKVHSGFLNGASDLLKQIQPCLAQLLTHAIRPVWLTGHSLGGALATVTGALLTQSHSMPTPVRPQGVYVFGCPRIGNTKFANNYPAPLWRFANQSDLLPHVPLESPSGIFGLLPWIEDYVHVGQSVYFDERLSVQVGIEPPRPSLLDFSASPILNHAPIAYSILAWNNA